VSVSPDENRTGTSPQEIVTEKNVIHVSLNAVEEKQPITISDQILLSDSATRKRVTYTIVSAFILANISTYIMIYLIYYRDQAELAAHMVLPQQRTITTGIVISVIGATTVQLGALALAIGRYLFPRAITQSSGRRDGLD